MKKVIMLCLLLSAAAAWSVSPAGQAGRDLRLFFRDNCALCHGPDGTGRDAQGKSLKGQDFTDARWREGTKDAKMVKTILKGRFFGLAMPGYKDKLTPEEAQRIVTEIIRQAVKGAEIGPVPVPAVSTVPVSRQSP